ncbi:hypothetical protein [Streptomyces sp. JV178]|nr:hypothetical protein [Streptomyces sp. JV178]
MTVVTAAMTVVTAAMTGRHGRLERDDATMPAATPHQPMGR